MPHSPILVVAMIACTGPADPGQRDNNTPMPSATPPTQSTTNEPGGERSIDLVDIESISTRWSAAAGWLLDDPQVLADLDGDGYAEFIVTAHNAAEGDLRTLLVRGPARRSVTLPGDEFATFTGVDKVLSDADLTGDGQRDLVFSTFYTFGLQPPESDNHVAVGPFSGTTHPPTTGQSIGVATPMDVNGDGVMDYVTGTSDPGADRIEVTWGPLSRLGTVPPDFVVDPRCGDDETDTAQYEGTVKVGPDVTGDGLRDIWVYGALWECPTWILPVATGTVIPEDDPAAYPGVLDFEVIPDRTGDGNPDVWHNHSIVEAPVTFVDDTVVGVSTITPPDFSVFFPAGVDVNGDNLGDFVAVDALILPAEGEVVSGPPGMDLTLDETLFVVPSGPTLPSPIPETVYDIRGGSLHSTGHVEDGIAFVLVRLNDLSEGDLGPAGDVVVVDIGAGTAAEF